MPCGACGVMNRETSSFHTGPHILPTCGSALNVWRLSMPVACVCQNPKCGKLFHIPPSRIAKGGGVYCSYACRKLAEPRVCQNPSCGKTFYVPQAVIKEGGGVYCSNTCRHLVAASPAFFWNKVLRCAHGIDCLYCCWPYQEGRNPEGYGLFTVIIDGHKTRVNAHRKAWE